MGSMWNVQRVSIRLSAIMAAGLVAGCLGTEEEQRPVIEENLGPGVIFSPYDINAFPLNTVVCDPFNGEAPPNTTPQNGILGKLFYRGDGQPRWYSSLDYVANAQASSQNLFFSDLNVPTRPFSTGFASQTQDVLKNDAGGTLIEFFGVKFNTVIKLGPNDPTGTYELAVLSDDGVTFKAKNSDGTWRTLISNEGDHATKMACMSDTVTFDANTELEIELTYYQGPRYHISNVLMWRPIAQAGQDSQCGKSGNTYFFNGDTDSSARQPYLDLLARGWKPLEPANFFLPGASNGGGAIYNPCAGGGVDPTQQNFVIREVALTDAWMSWVTDIPATSQILVTNLNTGVAVLTPTDNILRTQHTVRLSSLEPGTPYKVKAVSISDTLGKAFSYELQFTTP